MNLSMLTSKKPTDFKSKLKKIIEQRPKIIPVVNPYNFENIFQLVRETFLLSKKDVLKKNAKGKLNRTRINVVARQMTMHILKENTSQRLRAIGRNFMANGRGYDHSTVIHASEQIINLTNRNFGERKIRQALDIIEEILKKQYVFYVKEINK